MAKESPWLSINTNPPKLDVNILSRSGDKYGYGCNIKAFKFYSNVVDESEAGEFLEGRGFIEWMEIPL